MCFGTTRTTGAAGRLSEVWPHWHQSYGPFWVDTPWSRLCGRSWPALSIRSPTARPHRRGWSAGPGAASKEKSRRHDCRKPRHQGPKRRSAEPRTSSTTSTSWPTLSTSSTAYPPSFSASRRPSRWAVMSLGHPAGQAFLELEPPGARLHHPDQLGHPDDLAVRHITHDGGAGEGQQVVLTQRGETDPESTAISS